MRATDDADKSVARIRELVVWFDPTPGPVAGGYMLSLATRPFRAPDSPTYFFRNNSLIRLPNCGISSVVFNSDPFANFVANPRNVSTAVDEYGIHQASGRKASRFTWTCCGWTNSIIPS